VYTLLNCATSSHHKHQLLLFIIIIIIITRRGYNCQAGTVYGRVTRGPVLMGCSVRLSVRHTKTSYFTSNKDRNVPRLAVFWMFKGQGREKAEIVLALSEALSRICMVR